MFIFLPLINSSVIGSVITIGSSCFGYEGYQQSYHQTQSIFCAFYLD